MLRCTRALMTTLGAPVPPPIFSLPIADGRPTIPLRAVATMRETTPEPPLTRRTLACSRASAERGSLNLRMSDSPCHTNYGSRHVRLGEWSARAGQIIWIFRIRLPDVH
ncbi:hypothetical protein MRB53_040498 [Persea americana]|nr:hypothetical protein MRB53_040498 [Persea americana]